MPTVAETKKRALGVLTHQIRKLTSLEQAQPLLLRFRKAIGPLDEMDDDTPAPKSATRFLDSFKTEIQ